MTENWKYFIMIFLGGQDVIELWGEGGGVGTHTHAHPHKIVSFKVIITLYLVCAYFRTLFLKGTTTKFNFKSLL